MVTIGLVPTRLPWASIATARKWKVSPGWPDTGQLAKSTGGWPDSTFSQVKKVTLLFTSMFTVNAGAPVAAQLKFATAPRPLPTTSNVLIETLSVTVTVDEGVGLE